MSVFPTAGHLASWAGLCPGNNESAVLFAADVEGDNVRVVTSYRPDPGEWQADLTARRPKR